VSSLVKIPLKLIDKMILLVRGEKVIRDSDLAALYGVTTSRLNEQVKRNPHRFSGFCISLDESGIYRLDVANCDFKFKTRWPPKTTSRVHRTRRDYGGECLSQ